MKKYFFALGILSLVVVACQHHIDDPILVDNGTGNGGNGGNGGGGGGNTDTVVPYVNPHPCDPDTVYFVNDIAPFIANSCAMPNCHDASGGGDADPYTTYSQINAHRNSIYQALLGNSEETMPPPSSGITITQAQITMFHTWVLQGHHNNSCIEDCDPNQAITFAGVVSPFISTYCANCHDASTPSGGVPLTSYAQILDVASDGRLMNSLHGTNGVSLMPPGVSMPACKIDQIQAWVDAGSPNN
jgi:cytochrome c5